MGDQNFSEAYGCVKKQRLKKGKRKHPYDITYMWNLKYDTNEPIYETETESRT